MQATLIKNRTMELMLRILRVSLLPSVIRNSQQSFTRSLCSYSQSDTATNTDSEKKLIDVLKKRFPNNYEIQVADVSGGCGAMYDVTVITPEFKGISIVKQHRMVTEALKEEIKQMHGLRISTNHEPFSEDHNK